MKQKFDVTGMTCSACSAHVEKSVRKLPGVSSVAVNLLQNTMMVEYDGDALSNAQICDAVKAGDVLVILEAMKMEKPLLAPRAGTVTSLSIKQGDTVTAGQKLGTVGTVGCECAEESHIHVEVKQGEAYLDPAKLPE